MPSNVDPTLTPEVSGINAGKILSDKLRNVLSVIKSELEDAEARDTTNLNAARTYADAKVAALLGSAPALLDTLSELANALGNNPNFATTMTTALAGKESTANKNQPNGYLGLDAQGNVAGFNVTLRTGNLAALKTLTAPKGELAVALNSVNGYPEALVAFGDTSNTNLVFPTVPEDAFDIYGRVNFKNGTPGLLKVNNTVLGLPYEVASFTADLNTPNGYGGGLSLRGQDNTATGGTGGDVSLMGGGGANTPDVTTGMAWIGGGDTPVVLARCGYDVDFNQIPQLGFFNKAKDYTPVEQPTNVASGGAMTANTGAAVLANSTFTGGIGTSAYTIGQIVRALKLVGLIAE